MTSYEKVTYRPEGRLNRTVLLQDAKVGGHPDGMLGEFLTGVEVTSEGEVRYGRRFDERQHIISTDLILRREPLVMDLTYGILVAPEAAGRTVPL